MNGHFSFAYAGASYRVFNVLRSSPQPILPGKGPSAFATEGPGRIREVEDSNSVGKKMPTLKIHLPIY